MAQKKIYYIPFDHLGFNFDLVKKGKLHIARNIVVILIIRVGSMVGKLTGVLWDVIVTTGWG